MAVETAQWRAGTAGLLLAAVRGIISCSPAGFFALVLAILLLMGGVEPNPGPRNDVSCELCNTVSLHEEPTMSEANEQRLMGEGPFAAVQRLIEEGEDMENLARRTLQDLKSLEVHDEAVVDGNTQLGSADVTGETDESELHLMARSGHLQSVKKILKNGDVSVNLKNSRGETALHCSAREGHVCVVRYLALEKRADVEVRNLSQDTPLALAASNGHLSVLRILAREAKASKGCRNCSGDSVLHLAVRGSHLGCVCWLVMNYKELVGMTNKAGETALHLAAKEGQLDVVCFLVNQRQGSVNATNDDDQTPLYYAVEGNHIDIAKCLVEDGHVNVTDINKSGETVLHLAAVVGNVPMLKYLLLRSKEYISTCGRLNNGESVLSYAVRIGMVGAIRSLATEAEAEGDECEEIQWALFLASVLGHLPLIQFLIQTAEADVAAADERGCTALHHAAVKGHLDVVKWLVQVAGADLQAEDIDGYTPLQMAKSADIKQFLLDRSRTDH